MNLTFSHLDSCITLWTPCLLLRQSPQCPHKEVRAIIPNPNRPGHSPLQNQPEFFSYPSQHFWPWLWTSFPALVLSGPWSILVLTRLSLLSKQRLIVQLKFLEPRKPLSSLFLTQLLKYTSKLKNLEEAYFLVASFELRVLSIIIRVFGCFPLGAYQNHNSHYNYVRKPLSSPSCSVFCEEKNSALFIFMALHRMVAESPILLPEASWWSGWFSWMAINWPNPKSFNKWQILRFKGQISNV